jgi:TolA-binding protein
MNLSDIPVYTQALFGIGAILIAILTWLRSTAKKSAVVIADLAAEGVKKVTEGVAILTKIDLKVDHIDQRLKEVKGEMVEVQAFMNASQRDRTELHVRVEDHERRIATLEGRE